MTDVLCPILGVLALLFLSLWLHALERLSGARETIAALSEDLRCATDPDPANPWRRGQ